MPKKMRRGAIRSALSERLREGNIVIIDEFGFDNPKTSAFLSAMSTLGIIDKKTSPKTLIIDSLDNANLILSSRNIKRTKVTNSFGLNIYDIIYHEKLLISKAALDEITALFDPARETGKATEEAPEVVEEKPKAKKAAKPKAEKPAKEAAPVEAAAAEDAPVEVVADAVDVEPTVADAAPAADTAAEPATAEESGEEVTDNG